MPSFTRRHAAYVGLGMACGLAVAVGGGEASATTCLPSPITETFELSLRETAREGAPAEAVANLDEVTQLRGRIFTRGQGFTTEGKGLTLRFEDDGLRQDYVLDSPIEPTPQARDHIQEVERRSIRSVLCGRARFDAVRPGVYVFADDRVGEDDTMVLDDPVVTVTADRREMHLAFGYEGAAWVAIYDVDDTHHGGVEPGCGCSTAPSGWGWMGALALLVLIRARPAA